MIDVISKGENHKAINIGKLDQLSAHKFIHPKLGTVDHSRLFVGDLLGATGSEISFRELSPQTTISFLHKHVKHEEIYIFLKGSGCYQVDDCEFEIIEGSVVRVAPEGSRTLSNRSDDSMIYMVIQSSENTLAGYDISDGLRVDGKIKI